MKNDTGFTLIELLLVVAIIGILTSIVLNSLNTARGKSKIAAVKSEMNSMRNTAALYFDDFGGSYGSDGTDCSNIASVFDPSATNSLHPLVQSVETKVSNTAVCANDRASFAVAIPLPDGTNWCVDSQGYVNVTALSLAGAGSVQERVACQ
ncbi:hypothetical protein BH11PAT3_BH11PAT3_0630 [soil metagenome]